MKKIYFGVLVVMCIICGLPNATFAYETSQQKAIALGKTHVLYTITYEFSNKARDLYLPTDAFRNALPTNAGHALSYDFYKNNQFLKDAAVSQAVVVSKVPIVNGMYKVAKGTSATFTLVVLLSATNPDYGANYALQVTALPFLMDTYHEQLNPSELQYYKTPAIRLNSGQIIEHAVINLSK